MTSRILRVSNLRRYFVVSPLYHVQPAYHTCLTSRRLHVPKDFVTTPIHYQDPRELVKTVVKGGNYRLENRNFWLRCSSAVLYHGDSFSAKELLLIANAFGKVNHHDTVLFKAIANLSLQHEDEWRLSELPILLDSFRSCGVFEQQLFQRVLSIIVKDVNKLGPTGVALTLHSLTVTAGFMPDKATLDALVSPLFTNISQFSVEDLNMLVAALAHVNYRNFVLLKLLAHHVAGLPDYSRSCYSLLKAMIHLEYVDENVAVMATDFVRANVHFMHVGAIPELLKVLLAIHVHTRIDTNVYRAIIRVVTRSQDHVDWRIIFGVKGALHAIDHGDTYLDELCIHFKELIRVKFNTKEKLKLLRSCKNYPLPLEHLYEAIISSFQNNTNTQHMSDSLSDSAIVSDEEFLDLFFIFSELGFVKGICRCLLALDINRRSITGHVAIKQYELLKRHLNYEDLLLTLTGKDSAVSWLQGSIDSDTSATMDGFTRHEVHNVNEHTKKHGTTISHGISSFMEDRMIEGDIDRIMASWKYIETEYRNAGPTDLVLGICYADTLDFMCNLIPRVIEMPLEELQPEVVPAMLKRSLLLSQREGRILRPVKDLHLHLFKKLANKDSIGKLSTPSFIALVDVMNEIDYTPVNHVLTLMNKCSIDRISSGNPATKRLLCNHSIRLLKIGINTSGMGCTELAECICMNAQHIEPDRVQHLLEILVELQFTGKTYIDMLEPLVEKAISIDSDMMRVHMIDEYSTKLGLSLKNGINY